MFNKKEVPAVGCSLGIERVFAIMEKKDKNQATRDTETQVLVAFMGNYLSPATAELVNVLWNAKLKAEFLVSERQSKHFEHAERSGIPLIVMVGDELNEGN